MHRVDVEQMLEELTPFELRRWQAYDVLEPLGLEKLYSILSLIGAGLCQVWGAKGIKPEHFLPTERGAKPKQRRTQTTAEMKSVIAQAVALQRAAAEESQDGNGRRFGR